MFKLGEESVKRNLKVGVGLMCRHCDARGEQYKHIKDGMIGDLVLLRAYRMAGPTATAFSKPRPKDINELEYQIRRFHSFLWASGGAYSDFLVKKQEHLAAQASLETSVAGKVRRELEWLKRGAKARTTKAKGRIQQAGQLVEQLSDLRTRNTQTTAAQLDFAGTARQKFRFDRIAFAPLVPTD